MGNRKSWTGRAPSLARRQTYSVSPGETIGIQTSDQQGNAPLRLDASGGEGDTTVRLSACAEIDGQTMCAEGKLVWHSPHNRGAKRRVPRSPKRAA